MENIKSNPNAGGIIGAVFLDLRKAFDTVNLLTESFELLCELTQMDGIIQLIKDAVRVHNTKSITCENNLGVPQGSA